jgi:hypothetical protein
MIFSSTNFFTNSLEKKIKKKIEVKVIVRSGKNGPVSKRIGNNGIINLKNSSLVKVLCILPFKIS